MRSQTAAAYLKKFAPDHEITSAGTKVVEENTVGDRAKTVPEASLVVAILNEDGIDIAHSPRTQLTEALAAPQDLIIYMTEPDQTPDYIKENKAAVYWDVPDPRDLPAPEVRKTRDLLKKHAQQLADLLNTAS